MTRTATCLLVINSMLVIMMPLLCSAEESTRRYTTREERRDAAISHQLNDWLSVSPLVELETSRLNLTPVDGEDVELRERSAVLEMELVAIFSDWAGAEFVYEYDDVRHGFVLDEAIVEVEYENFKLEAGRYTLPFGEYYSRFIIGPILEFSETRARSVSVVYEQEDALEIALFFFKGKYNLSTADDDHLDWGMAINYEGEGFTSGISYLSDLSETDEKMLEDTVSYINRVDAVSAYISLDFDLYAISLETVYALSDFKELDANANKPNAWNLELGIYPSDLYEFAVRLEGSKELQDAPEYQAGLGGSWHVNQYVSMTLEYLYGQFKRGFVEENDQLLSSQQQLAFQAVLTF